jgi:hypothetical protein
VQPGDGPAAEETQYHGPIEGEPGDEPSEEPSPLQDNAKFGEKYVYSDGLEVEVIKIRNGRFTASQNPGRWRAAVCRSTTASWSAGAEWDMSGEWQCGAGSGERHLGASESRGEGGKRFGALQPCFAFRAAIERRITASDLGQPRGTGGRLPRSLPELGNGSA